MAIPRPHSSSGTDLPPTIEPRASPYLEATYQDPPLPVSPQRYLENLAWQSAQEAGLTEAETLVFFRIIKSESNWVIDAHNPIGTASGLLQYLDSTFQKYCVDKYQLGTMEDKNDPAIQLQCATKMLSEGGWEHWSASRNNWQ